MKCFIGLGANLGPRRETLEKAAQALRACSQDHFFQISPIYSTPALVPPKAPWDWNIPFFNAVAQIKWSGTANELLRRLKSIERELGRTEKERWAPRTIDLDLITFGQQVIQEPSLQVPHSGVFNRSFVLDPLKDLDPGFVIPQDQTSVVVRARKLSTRQALVMGIVNLTPDSFSDGGELDKMSALEMKFKKMDEIGVSIFDLGAESTRPGASSLDIEEEWNRLKPALQYLQSFYQGKLIRPLISIDTRKPEIAERALELGADWINDVSGGSHPGMMELFKRTQCPFVLMHSLTVPADSKVTFSFDQDPIAELKSWYQTKIEDLCRFGIDPHRMIFDPGIGFGKTAAQSIAILKRINEFDTLPSRFLVGHSRKSFMKSWGLDSRVQRDAATLGISMELVKKGVDIIRVHDFETHIIALQTRNEVFS